MMLRRYIAIILISLANSFILVHAVVPHFHHDGIVCFDASKDTSCASCSIYGEHEKCTHEEQNPSHEHLEMCDLPQIVERDGNASDDYQTLLPLQFQLILSDFQYQNADLSFLCDLVEVKSKYYKPYLDTYNSPYVGSTFGLRAPPARIIL